MILHILCDNPMVSEQMLENASREQDFLLWLKNSRCSSC